MTCEGRDLMPRKCFPGAGKPFPRKFQYRVCPSPIFLQSLFNDCNELWAINGPISNKIKTLVQSSQSPVLVQGLSDGQWAARRPTYKIQKLSRLCLSQTFVISLFIGCRRAAGHGLQLMKSKLCPESVYKTWAYCGFS